MNVHSSQLRTLNVEAPKHSPGSRGSAVQQQDGAASFAGHLDADHVPPAQAARAALENRPDLADRPFGAIVSLFARHEELPAPADPEPDPPEETNGEAPPENEAGGVAAETSGRATEAGSESAEAEPDQQESTPTV
jgi:hypothetical protein